jgi:hypothetical protein
MTFSRDCTAFDFHPPYKEILTGLLTAPHITKYTVIVVNREHSSNNAIYVQRDDASKTDTSQRPTSSQTPNPSSRFYAEYFDPEQATSDLQVCLRFRCDSR